MTEDEDLVTEPFSGLPFTIDNAIWLAEWKIKGLEDSIRMGCNGYELAKNCIRMHRRLISWLKELQELRRVKA